MEGQGESEKEKWVAEGKPPMMSERRKKSNIPMEVRTNTVKKKKGVQSMRIYDQITSTKEGSKKLKHPVFYDNSKTHNEDLKPLIG